jgi:hypothetical protein
MLPLTTASDLFAISQGAKNTGPELCHWCGSACTAQRLHDDPPPQPFRKNTSAAKFPGRLYVCNGCWNWRAPRRSVVYLAPSSDGTHIIRDRQAAKDHSWLILPERAWALRKEFEGPSLYAILLEPPRQFALAIKDGDFPTQIQSTILNDHAFDIRLDTELHFTVNNIPHSYTPYELDKGLRDGPNGRGPGVQALMRVFGEWKRPTPEAKPVTSPQGGRPKGEEVSGGSLKKAARNASSRA